MNPPFFHLDTQREKCLSCWVMAVLLSSEDLKVCTSQSFSAFLQSSYILTCSSPPEISSCHIIHDTPPYYMTPGTRYVSVESIPCCSMRYIHSVLYVHIHTIQALTLLFGSLVASIHIRMYCKAGLGCTYALFCYGLPLRISWQCVCCMCRWRVGLWQLFRCVAGSA